MRTLVSVIAVGLLTAACSHNLTHEEAEKVVTSSPLIQPADHVAVEAVSPSAENEAIARTTIAGQALNLKFRRYDKGWTWESAETKGGGWIANDLAIAEIREKQRASAAVEFAKHHHAEYERTVQTILILSHVIPNPTMGMNASEFPIRRARMLGMQQEVAKRAPDRQLWVDVLSQDPAKDAWGHDVQVRFDESKRQAFIYSPGPDGTMNSGDEVICSVKAREGFEDGRMVWNMDLGWSVPENLGDIVEPLTDKPFGQIEFTKAAK